MRRNRDVPAGEVRRFTIESRALAGNRLGDPASRELQVYLPAGWDGSRRLPLLVDLVGFTGSGQAHTNWRAFTENLPERLDRLIGTGAMPPVAVAFPDCFTRLGMTEKVCRCWWIWPASPAAVYRTRIGSASARTCRSGSTG